MIPPFFFVLLCRLFVNINGESPAYMLDVEIEGIIYRPSAVAEQVSSNTTCTAVYTEEHNIIELRTAAIHKVGALRDVAPLQAAWQHKYCLAICCYWLFF